jgi:hypothetical protein
MRTTLIAIVSVVVLPTTAVAAHLTVICPASVAASASTPDPGWVSVAAFGHAPRPWSKSPLILDHIEVYAGEPSKGASLVPDEDRRVSGRVRESTWALKGEHWVGCHYRGEARFLAKRLPPSVRSCRSQYETSKTAVRVRRFECEVGDV